MIEYQVFGVYEDGSDEYLGSFVEISDAENFMQNTERHYRFHIYCHKEELFRIGEYQFGD